MFILIYTDTSSYQLCPLREPSGSYNPVATSSPSPQALFLKSIIQWQEQDSLKERPILGLTGKTPEEPRSQNAQS